MLESFYNFLSRNLVGGFQISNNREYERTEGVREVGVEGVCEEREVLGKLSEGNIGT